MEKILGVDKDAKRPELEVINDDVFEISLTDAQVEDAKSKFKFIDGMLSCETEVHSICGEPTKLIGPDYISFCPHCDVICEGQTEVI